jgi:CO/xanthine dehydrogenase FAD-binding subunit
MPTLKDFRRPGSIAEAVAMVRGGPGRGSFIAGGTMLGAAQAIPYDYLVDITGLGLNEIRKGGHLIHIGAAASIQQLATCPILETPSLRFLAQAAPSVATRQIRNMATVGGDLISGYPMVDLPAAFLVLDAQLGLVGSDRTKLSLRDFYDSQSLGRLKGDLLAEITFQVPPADFRGSFVKLARTQNDVALIDLACLVRSSQGQFQEVRVGLGSTVLRPLRLTAVEEFLPGRPVDGRTLAQAAGLATRNLAILDNFRGSRAYRTQMVQVLVRRSLMACAQEGSGDR